MSTNKKWWNCRQPFGQTDLTTIAPTRRAAAKQYRNWLRKQGIRPLFVIITKWNVT